MNKLLSQTIIGIQGGRGSFNEEAVRQYLKREKIKKCQIKYLYSSPLVVKALLAGEIDYGQVALYNTLGGWVEETQKALHRPKVKIVDLITIRISHALMVHPQASLEKIKTIMAHPQVFRQCQENLAKKFPNLKKISGKGKLIDSALVAQKIAQGEIPATTGVIGSKIISSIYSLKIVAENLEDTPQNYTTFIYLKKLPS